MSARHWPMCKQPGCGNRCCLRLLSPYCYPHTFLRGASFTHEELRRDLDLRVTRTAAEVQET